MKNYSIAIFGSTLRADFDIYSDKDLLIVADNYETLNDLGTKYSKDKWSISFYTYSKLEYLSKNGSLFIKHLQNESKIVVDQRDRLSLILSGFIEKTDYQNAITESKEYFNILKKIPGTTLGYAWFCDSLYVGLRNYLVFQNAENRIFEFSFIKLLNIIKEKGIIGNSDIDALKELRVVKRNYREDVFTELPSKEFVQKIISIVMKIGVSKSSEIINPVEFQIYVEEHITVESFNPYQRLRLVEGYYSSQNQNIPQLKKIISNPQFYALKMKNNIYTKKLIEQIKKEHTTSCISNSALNIDTRVKI